MMLSECQEVLSQDQYTDDSDKENIIDDVSMYHITNDEKN